MSSFEQAAGTICFEGGECNACPIKLWARQPQHSSQFIGIAAINNILVLKRARIPCINILDVLAKGMKSTDEDVASAAGQMMDAYVLRGEDGNA